jgi:hypothetical protein
MACLGSFITTPVAAQVVFAEPLPFGAAPSDESYGTSPSFEINSGGYAGGPTLRIVQRCQYPDGWNVTDFNRDINGTPAGLDHTCPTYRQSRVQSRY